MSLSVAAEILDFAGTVAFMVNCTLLAHFKLVVDTVESFKLGSMNFASLKLPFFCQICLRVALVSLWPFVVLGLLKGEKYLLVDRKHINIRYSPKSRLAKGTPQFVVDKQIFDTERADRMATLNEYSRQIRVKRKLHFAKQAAFGVEQIAWKSFCLSLGLHVFVDQSGCAINAVDAFGFSYHSSFILIATT